MKFPIQVILIGLRKDNGDSQKDLAELIGSNETTYRNKELGRNKFDHAELFLISKKYGKKIEDIFLPPLITNRDKEKEPA